MKNYRYFVYLTQEDLDASIPNFTGTIFAFNRIEAERLVGEMHPGSYYLYCVL